MLNGISEKELSKSQNVIVEDVSGGTSNTGKSRWSDNACRNKWFDEQCQIVKGTLMQS